MPADTPPRPWRDALLTACAPVIWGSTYIVTSEFLPPDRPFTAALIRALPAGLLLLLVTWRLPHKQHWGRLAVLSALNIGVFQALLFVAAYRLPGGLAAVLGAIQPLLVMLLAWAVDRQAPRGIPCAVLLQVYLAWPCCCCRRKPCSNPSAWQRPCWVRPQWPQVFG